MCRHGNHSSIWHVANCLRVVQRVLLGVLWVGPCGHSAADSNSWLWQCLCNHHNWLLRLKNRVHKLTKIIRCVLSVVLEEFYLRKERESQTFYYKRGQ